MSKSYIYLHIFESKNVGLSITNCTYISLSVILKELDQSLQLIFIKNLQEHRNLVLDILPLELVVVYVEVSDHPIQPLQPGRLLLEHGLEGGGVVEDVLVLGGQEARVSLVVKGSMKFREISNNRIF